MTEKVSYCFESCLCIPNVSFEGNSFISLNTYNRVLIPNYKLIKQLQKDLSDKKIVYVLVSEEEQQQIQSFLKNNQIALSLENVIVINDLSSKIKFINDNLITRHYDDCVHSCFNIKGNCKLCKPILVISKELEHNHPSNQLFEIFSF